MRLDHNIIETFIKKGSFHGLEYFIFNDTNMPISIGLFNKIKLIYHSFFILLSLLQLLCSQVILQAVDTDNF